MADKGLNKVILYKFGEEKISPSYVSFSKADDSVAWTEYEILALTIVAKTLELTVENR